METRFYNQWQDIKDQIRKGMQIIEDIFGVWLRPTHNHPHNQKQKSKQSFSDIRIMLTVLLTIRVFIRSFFCIVCQTLTWNKRATIVKTVSLTVIKEWLELCTSKFIDTALQQCTHSRNVSYSTYSIFSKTCTVVPQPPNSPNLPPVDFSCSKKLKWTLKGYFLNNRRTCIKICYRNYALCRNWIQRSIPTVQGTLGVVRLTVQGMILKEISYNNTKMTKINF